MVAFEVADVVHTYFKSTMRAVTLSVDPSIIASVHSFLPMFKKSLNGELLITNFATSSFCITSQIPSDARTYE